MKSIYTTILVIFFSATTLFGSNIVLAASQSEGAIPQTGDLCGGIGGNGQIVSVGNSGFTIKRNDDGSSQIIHLTNQATIKTSTGPISVSKLKTGERVTLVGGPNSDGSFTADTVVLCDGIQRNVIGQKIQSGQNRSVVFHKANAWSSYVNIFTILLVCLIWLIIVAYLRRKIKKNFVYLLFFTIFYVYIVEVLNYTLFQFQSLIVLKHFMPDLMLRGVAAGKSLNLIPLISLRLVDVRTTLLNVLLMMPFGFGLPFVTNFRLKKIVFIGLLFSIGIEFLQFITGYMAGITFRIADINDVIFNTLGVAIGYMLFVGFIRNYRRVFRNGRRSVNPIFRYIAERPQIDKE